MKANKIPNARTIKHTPAIIQVDADVMFVPAILLIIDFKHNIKRFCLENQEIKLYILNFY